MKRLMRYSTARADRKRESGNWKFALLPGTTRVLVIAALLLTAGCGSSTPNPKSPFSPTHQRHAADWLPAAHREAAQQDINSCAGCHGADFQGGVALVSCEKCHLGGADSKHPTDWTDEQKWSRHAEYIASFGNGACANAVCHGAELSGVAGSGPSCTGCHLEGVDSKHPRAWGQHAAFLHGDYAFENGDAACSNGACHGGDLQGVVGSGPGCNKCHAKPPHDVAGEFTAACSACHDKATTMLLMHPWDAPNAVNHKFYLEARANNTKSCAIAACHGTDLKGGENCPSCTSCHLGGVTRFHPVSFGTGTTIITEHQNYLTQNTTEGCANAACHGGDLLGGTAGPSCTSCHLGGVTTKHPLDFGGSPVKNHKAYVAANGTSGCEAAACHGEGLSGGTAGPSCTSCHLGGPTLKHPVSFGTTTVEVALNHKAYIELNAVDGADGMAGCRNGYCHGADLSGVADSGPACSSTACHQNGSPAILKNCESCHGKPPFGSAGAPSPNRAGAHAAHNALPGVVNVCDTCHGGAGTGTQNHFNRAVDIQIQAAYNAKSGAAVRNTDGTCSNVSCHGGKTTPVWLSGSIDVNNDCATCHAQGAAAGIPESNSYYSGRHETHMISHAPKVCGTCHDQTRLVLSHFMHLDTPELEGPASDTLRIPLVIASYNAGTKSCTTATGCHHPDPAIPRAWQ